MKDFNNAAEASDFLRVMKKIAIGDDCWEWTAQRDRQGYGRVWWNDAGKSLLAHRVVFELLVGPIPDHLELDHLCRTPSCVRPDHLEPVTRSENQRRGMGICGINSRKTHCVNGHPFTEENTQWELGHRRCRVCRTGQRHAREERKRQAA